LYALSVQTIGTKYYLINWTTAGEPAAMGATSRAPKVISNTTYARSSIPTLQDWNTGLGATFEDITPPAMGVAYGTIVRGYNLKTGVELWNVTLQGERMFSGSCNIADHGKVAILFEGGYYKAWNLADGSLAWTSEKMAYPWGEAAFGSYSVQSAYGLLYRQSYDAIYAFNWTNGKIVWKYEAPANPYETPYIDENGQTVYSFMTGAIIADGKMYVTNSEHTPTPPITRGWGVHCINATTGEKIWDISGIWAWSSSAFPGAIADGYLVASSSDGYMYVFGKGKSQTTVTVSQDVVAKGSTVLVKGTVLDMSPAQPGTPCVAKESMTVWMEFLHKQQSCPSDVKGVPVTLTAIKSDGKVIDLGTVITNGFYGTFGLDWMPEEEGTYTIVASFAGDDSYGSSSAATVITVGPAPAEIEIPEYPTPTDYTPILTGLAIAIIIVAILVVYDIITVRKLRK
jgi:outer membrane protein assembly factor BamB